MVTFQAGLLPNRWMQKSNVRSIGIKIPSATQPRQAHYNRGFGFTPLSPPWPSIMKSSMSPLPNLNRARIAFAHDTVMAAISFPLSMYLRLGDFYYFYLGEYIFGASLAFAAISAPIFLYSRMYRGIWAYASIEDLAVITKGVTLSIPNSFQHYSSSRGWSNCHDRYH